jgi:hypothetical protein
MTARELPEHVRAAYRLGACVVALRAAAGEGRTPVVVGRGAPLPELPGVAWSRARASQVGSLDAATARAVAFARAPDEARLLERPLPSSAAWSLYLDAGGRCYAVPFPLVAPAAVPHAGDA